MRHDARIRRLESGRICPTHLERVVCVPCTYHWHGTAEELVELRALHELLPPMDVEAMPSYGVCRVHRDQKLFCATCSRPYLAAQDATNLIESGQDKRYLELLTRLRQGAYEISREDCQT